MTQLDGDNSWNIREIYSAMYFGYEYGCMACLVPACVYFCFKISAFFFSSILMHTGELPQLTTILSQLSFLPHFLVSLLHIRVASRFLEVDKRRVACDTGGDKGGARWTSGEAVGADEEAAAALRKGAHVGTTAGHG